MTRNRSVVASFGTVWLVAVALPLLPTISLERARADSDEGKKLAYATDDARAEVASDWSLSITIAGTEQLAGLVRSMHPILSLNRVHVRANGRATLEDGKAKLENDEARVEGVYDDEEFLFDFDRRALPTDLATNKLEALMVALSAGRGYSLTNAGQFHSDDPNQDHNGEAMDHFLLGITRLPSKAVAAGGTYSLEWKGERHEKTKHGHYAFRQTTKVESIEAKGDGSLVTLVSELKGELEVPAAEKDASAEESWTRCAGTTRVVLQLPSGRVVSSGGKGQVTAYYRALGEDGNKNEVTLTFAVEGRNDFTRSERRKATWH